MHWQPRPDGRYSLAIPAVADARCGVDFSLTEAWRYGIALVKPAAETAIFGSQQRLQVLEKQRNKLSQYEQDHSHSLLKPCLMWNGSTLFEDLWVSSRLFFPWVSYIFRVFSFLMMFVCWWNHKSSPASSTVRRSSGTSAESLWRSQGGSQMVVPMVVHNMMTYVYIICAVCMKWVEYYIYIYIISICYIYIYTYIYIYVSSQIHICMHYMILYVM